LACVPDAQAAHRDAVAGLDGVGELSAMHGRVALPGLTQHTITGGIESRHHRLLIRGHSQPRIVVLPL
jgi:hypothetical protein